MIEMRKKCENCESRRRSGCTSMYEHLFKIGSVQQLRDVRDTLMDKRPDLVRFAIQAIEDRLSRFDHVDRRVAEALRLAFMESLVVETEVILSEDDKKRLSERAHEAVLARIPEERIKQDVRRRMSYFGDVAEDEEDGDEFYGYRWLQ